MTTVGHVWLVDDDDADNHFHRRVIERAEFATTIVEYTRPDDALSELRSGSVAPPDVLFLDINMPGMTGFELLTSLRATAPDALDGVRVFILSTSVDPTEEARALDLPGVEGYFVKPLTADHLRIVAPG